MHSSDYIDVTKLWVEEFIIGHNICPFAAKPFEEGKVKWEVLNEAAEFTNVIQAALEKFVKEDWDSFSTCFLIMPFLKNFDDLVEVFYVIQEVAEDLNFSEKLQYAAFHPQSHYGDIDKDEPVNFANRSPFAMVQLLKVDELDSLNITDDFKDEFLQKNESLLTELGVEELSRKLDEYRK